MLLALLALALVALVLLVCALARRNARSRARRLRRRAIRPHGLDLELRDPARARAAERRARELLRSCVNEEEWAMYRDLGFIQVEGRRSREGDGGYAYLLYPHKPIVAYVPRTGRLLSEYCVEFPDLTAAIAQSRLPDSDDVLAKWMALTGDERRLIRNANMHLPGRQVDPARVRRDIWRLSEWRRQRRSAARARSA